MRILHPTLLASLVTGCFSPSPMLGEEGAHWDASEQAAEAQASIEVSAPMPNAVITGDAVVVEGVAQGVHGITVNGVAVQPDEAGHFSTTVTGLAGVEVIVVEGTDATGEVQAERIAVRVAEEWSEHQTIERALMFSMNDDGLGFVGAWGAEQVDQETITELALAANPVYATTSDWFSMVEINVESVEFSGTSAVFRATDGHFFTELGLQGVVVTGTVEVSMLGMDDTINIVLEADTAAITGDLSMAVVDGALSLDVGNKAVHMSGLEIETDGFQDLLESDAFADALMDEAGPMLATEVLSMALPMIEDYINDLTKLGVHPLLGMDVDIQPTISDVVVDNGGVVFVFDVDIDRTEDLKGLIYQVDNQAELNAKAQAFGILIHDNLINTLLHSLWVRGGFDTVYSTESDTLSDLANTLFESSATTATTHLAMPPVVTDEGGYPVISIGELRVELDTPDGEPGEQGIFVIDGSATVGLALDDCQIKLGMDDIVANPVAIETDWGMAHPESAEILKERVPSSVIRALLGGLSVPLPDLREVGASVGEVSRGSDGHSTLVLVE